MNEEILEIINRQLNGESLSVGELELLNNWKHASIHNQEAFDALNNASFMKSALREMDGFETDKERNWKRMLSEIDETRETPRSVPIMKRPLLRYAAAILLLVVGAVFYFRMNDKQQPETVATQQPKPKSTDIPAPSVSRAVITLASGRQVYLDSLANGAIAKEGGVDIRKSEDGRIVYSKDVVSGALHFNTLNVPRGSQTAALVLSDGTKVYLNAASSLKYPVAFAANERTVEVTGEAYFEVAKDASRPFKVLSGDVTTIVLGTHFNVNAYTDEESGSITLLEGKIKVLHGQQTVVAKPGEQVQSSVDGSLRLNAHADLAQVMAWQKGMFLFTDMTLPGILRQISRWYNVTVKFNGPVPATSFGGGLSRNLPLSDVLKLLESDKVQFSLSGNILTVQSK